MNRKRMLARHSRLAADEVTKVRVDEFSRSAVDALATWTCNHGSLTGPGWEIARQFILFEMMNAGICYDHAHELLRESEREHGDAWGNKR